MLATFGMGCFWCSQDSFKKVNGVTGTLVGYMGGVVKNPTYVQVCSGSTGHTEVIRINYEPKVITYESLLEIFFKSHDATQLNRQGADSGFQYRSVIFYHSESQRRTAHKAIKSIKGCVTALEPASTFYPAEEYHQDYYDKHKFIKFIKEGRL